MRQRGVGLPVSPDRPQRSCCDDQLNPPRAPERHSLADCTTQMPHSGSHMPNSVCSRRKSPHADDHNHLIPCGSVFTFSHDQDPNRTIQWIGCSTSAGPAVSDVRMDGVKRRSILEALQARLVGLEESVSRE